MSAGETPQPLPRIGDYEVLNLLGAGGMGRVYKVRNVITDRIEAMKILLPEIAGREEVAARFLREIKVLAALNHPNIAALHTALTIDNQLLMIMEYVEGMALSAVLQRGPLPPAEALSYIDQVLDALSFAHQRHVIHRDIKPANMMLCTDGTVKLMDFGIARTDDESSALTAPGSTLGSMNYMSPEQVKGEKTDERSDLYSLGISLYELVTAERPFQGDTSYALMNAHLNQAPRPPIELQPNIPAGLNDIILTAIAKDPAQRFQSADAFRRAVKTVLRELQESKTMIQGSVDDTTGSRTPLPQVRTGPITRPRPAANTPAPLASRIGVVPVAPTPVPGAPTAQKTPVPPSMATTASTAVPVGQKTVLAASTASAAAPAPATVSPAPVATTSTSRGIYVAIGAVAVLIVLIAAGLYIPKSRRAAAEKESAPIEKPVAPVPAQPATQPVTQPPAATASAPTQPVETKPAEQPTSSAPANASPVNTAPAKTLATKATPKQNSAPTQDSGAAAAAAAAAEKAKAAELDQIEHDIDQLATRAASVNASLQTLQRQQAASGIGLRGDMVAHQSSMNLNLSKAQEAIAHNDAERAKRFADKVTADLEALEKFLGR